MDQDQTLPLLIFGRLCELKEPVMTVRPSTIITLLCEMAWGESTKAETLVCSKKVAAEYPRRTLLCPGVVRCKKWRLLAFVDGCHADIATLRAAWSNVAAHQGCLSARAFE